MDDQATFARADEPGRSVLLVTGEIDLGVAGRFASAVKDLLEHASAPATIDLTGVTFFNSTGICVFCDEADTARRH